MSGGTFKGWLIGTVAGMAAGIAVTKAMECTDFGQSCMRKGRKMIKAMKNVF